MTIYNNINYIEQFSDKPMRTDDTHNYRRYRIGRLKHQIWLNNRKNKNEIIIDTHDKFIVDNTQKGKTCAFGSAGYYLEDLIPNLTVIEEWKVVQKFYPECIIVDSRNEIGDIFPHTFDNFIVNNNRGDLWVHDGPTEHCVNYAKAMNKSCLFFYSFRDTQIIFNRFEDQYEHFYKWAMSLKDICNLHLVWHDIKFKENTEEMKFNALENPDTSNGNLKFVFRYDSNTPLE